LIAGGTICTFIAVWTFSSETPTWCFLSQLSQNWYNDSSWDFAHSKCSIPCLSLLVTRIFYQLPSFLSNFPNFFILHVVEQQISENWTIFSQISHHVPYHRKICIVCEYIQASESIKLTTALVIPKSQQ